MMSILGAAGILGLALAAQPSIRETTMEATMRLLTPSLKGDASVNGDKLPKRMQETGRLSVPMPGLVLFFNETGCITAALDPKNLTTNDWQCLDGAPVASLKDFVGESVEGQRALVLLSPLYNVEALKAIGSGKDAFWDERKAELDALQESLKQSYPEAQIYALYIPFGV